MNCNDVRENLIELLTDGPADPQVKAHVSQCNTCTEELGSMRKTMALLDEWESPEPSPYFLTRLRAHVKEEREKVPASMFGWLRRPMLAAGQRIRISAISCAMDAQRIGMSRICVAQFAFLQIGEQVKGRSKERALTILQC